MMWSLTHSAHFWKNSVCWCCTAWCHHPLRMTPQLMVGVGLLRAKPERCLRLAPAGTFQLKGSSSRKGSRCYPVLLWLSRKQINLHLCPFQRLSGGMDQFKNTHSGKHPHWEGKEPGAVVLLQQIKARGGEQRCGCFPGKAQNQQREG